MQSDLMSTPIQECEHMNVRLGDASYGIDIGEGIIEKAKDRFDLDRKVFIVTDSGVPRKYFEAVAAQCREAKIFTFPEGEESKSTVTLEKILSAMLDFGMQRSDTAVAVGGGVVGDITALAASLYMRGIDFYNVPTTLLAAVDSSIGGKCAVNLGKTKNVMGAFYQPKGVLIDTETLKTLDKRQFISGLAEVVKMAATSDAELFSMLEDGLAEKDIKTLIYRALNIKKRVVEEDEKESGPRRILNFGHTLGHGIEALGGRLHGECVALGMIPMTTGDAKDRLINLLGVLGLKTADEYSLDEALGFIKHDKKASGEFVHAVVVDKIGHGKIEKLAFSDLSERIRKNV
jgi:3-dehydroquinate synthase